MMMGVLAREGSQRARTMVAEKKVVRSMMLKRPKWSPALFVVSKSVSCSSRVQRELEVQQRITHRESG